MRAVALGAGICANGRPEIGRICPFGYEVLGDDGFDVGAWLGRTVWVSDMVRAPHSLTFTATNSPTRNVTGSDAHT